MVERASNGHNLPGLTQAINNLEIRYAPPQEILTPDEKEDLAHIGIDPKIVRSVNRLPNSEEPIPISYGVEMTNGNNRITGEISIEIGFKDGMEHDWKRRVFFFPNKTAIKDGALINLPLSIINEGYQILVHDNKQDPDKKVKPLVRIDSVCKTSMYDGGHESSAENPGLGCDCTGQRNEAKKQISQSSKGLSILEPMDGRGNGEKVHAEQIQIQNYLHRKGKEILDTYKAVEAMGHKKDLRPDYYFIAGFIIAQMFGYTDIVFLSNNPDKIRALQESGINIDQSSLLDRQNLTYYQGLNALAKGNGGHIFTNGK